MTKSSTDPRERDLPNSPEDEFLARLERLVMKFLSMRFRGAHDLWTLQTDLLRLLQDIQKQIAQSKSLTSGGDRTGDLARLIHLRQIRWRCRRFGDAVAWVLLGLERRLILPLAMNDPVPVPSDDHGTRGTIAIAEGLANRRWGFPLLHDITDCLRIGDVTFISIGSDASPRTIEVKTHLVDQCDDDKGRIYNYSVNVVFQSASPNPFPAGSVDFLELEADSSATDNAQSEAKRPGRASARVDRQLRRMRNAVAQQEAKPGVITTIDSQLHITTEAESSDQGHIEDVRRLIRKARRSGYASMTIERTIFYAAIYKSEGLDDDSIRDSRILSDLTTSDVFFGDSSGRDSLVVHAIPPEERGRQAQLFMPFYLYPFPKSSIIDMMRGRLVIVALMNGGRVVEALESAGLHLCSGRGRQLWPAGPMYIEVERAGPDGRRYRAQVGHLDNHIAEMVYEFRGIQYLIDIANNMGGTAGVAISHKAD